MHIRLLALGTQGDVQPCIALGIGLQQEPLVVTLTPTWRMRSRAVLIGDGEAVNLVLERQPWETLVCLQPITFEFVGPDGITPSETIDLDYGADLSGPSSGNDPA